MVAAVNGHAIGLGLDLACLCDIRLAADSAKFASSFIKVSIVPGDGGAWILARIIGLSRASEMILTGDTIDTRTAESIGLVSRVVPGEQLLNEAHAVARRIAVNPAKALRLAKRLLREGQQQRLSDVLELSAAFQALAHETKDHEEAVAAFLEKARAAVHRRVVRKLVAKVVQTPSIADTNLHKRPRRTVQRTFGAKKESGHNRIF
jgi:2-(1,2-epoxy-1,2-dihydrophenyl)acetyl-CoA isomerase